MAHVTAGIARGRRERVTSFEDVAAAGDVSEGELLGVALSDGSAVCVFRLHGAIGALGNVCTHADFAMSDGVLHHDGTLECVWHGARFDCRTGAAVRHPAIDPLPVYHAREVGGRVLIASRPASLTEISP